VSRLGSGFQKDAFLAGLSQAENDCVSAAFRGVCCWLMTIVWPLKRIRKREEFEKALDAEVYYCEAVCFEGYGRLFVVG
jgi:hypothetical protein